MGKINVLNKHLAELIAAGEVVERPASAIKEMVENSIDSGANAITVEIKHGGNTFMRVTDNGCGIEKDDIRNAFVRHATSKISKEDDLNHIATLGFRGEALASISAVSKLELLTRTPESEFGVKYVIEGGEELEFEQIGAALGTTIIVRDLFYNTPARRKFLKKDATESNVVTAMIERMAISHPNVSFKLIRDSKQVINTPGDNNLRSAIFTVFGKEFADSLIPVDYTLNGIRVSGFTCTPTQSRKNRAMQFFFLNGRYIRTKTGIAALEQAYKNSIMVGMFPTCVLNITLDPTLVDVNVHPAKIEVRFSDERSIFNAVYYAVKSALSADETRVAFESTKNKAQKYIERGEQVLFDTQTAQNNKLRREFERKVMSGEIGESHDNSATPQTSPGEKSIKPMQKSGVQNENHVIKSDDSVNTNQEYSFLDEEKAQTNKISEPSAAYRTDNTAMIHEIHENKANVHENKPEAEPYSEPHKVISVTSEMQHNEPTAQPSVYDKKTAQPSVDIKPHIGFKYIGQAFDTYIIVECGKKLIIIDKHAAHERILFEKLKKRENAEPQMLLQPMDVTLSANEYDAVVSNIDRINDMGFDIDDFGMNTVRVRGVPAFLDGDDAKGLIEEMAGKLINKSTDFTPEFVDWLYHSVACRSAIKAGNRSTDRELIQLADIVLNDDSIRYCPHGRPVAAELKESEIQRRFSRI